MTAAGGIHLLQLHLGDRHAGLVLVHDRLGPGADLVSIWPRASVKAGWIGVRPITSRIMLSAADLIVFSGLRVLNRKSPASRMRQTHHEIDVDDVLVARQHQRFLQHVAADRAAARRHRPSGSR